MPSLPLSIRALTGILIAVLTVTGCQDLEGNGSASGPADLVNDLAARLDQGGTLTYSADYRLPGGQAGSIAQAWNPSRTSYVYPGGRLTVTTEATIECVTGESRSTCTLTPPPTPSRKPPAALLAGLNRGGLVAPEVVSSLLTAAGLDPDAVVKTADTTIAGRHASCVTVSRAGDAAASGYTACVTTEGALGSFTGVIDGTELDVAMTRYQDGIDPTAFDLPAGAEVVDRRPVAR